MEEYKYKLISNVAGDTSALRAFVDSLDALGQKYLYSAELSGRELTLTWNRWTPGEWKRSKTTMLPGGIKADVTNFVEDDPGLAPSLNEALAFLVRVKDEGTSLTGSVPERLPEKIELLDRLGLIDATYDVSFRGLDPISGPESMMWFSKQFRDYTVTDEGRDYLRRHVA